MINTKRLSGGGDTVVEKMMENSALIGSDLIELVWTPRNKQKRFAVARVVGFKVPIVDSNLDITENDITAGWVDGSINFYPDAAGNCWGYVYDSKENRQLLAESLSNGWFRIVDKKIREEVVSLAKEMDLNVEAAHIVEVLVKKSTREIAAEDHSKFLQQKVADLEEKLKKFNAALSDAEGKKEAFAEKRLKGVKIKRTDEENAD